MSTLTTELDTVVQRSGTNSNSLRTEAERASFASNVKRDIAAIVYQLNTVYNPLVSSLSSTVALNALDLGISGNSVFTHVNATASDAAAYWSTTNSRALTIKETVDLLLSEISRLENELQVALEQDAFDESVLEANIQTNLLNIQQLAKDTYGTGYTLDNDGNANLTYTLAQTLDAIGSHFTGYSSTGLAHASTYPTLTLNVALSNVALDTTIPQSTITDLTTDLANIRTYVGMDDAADTTPDYSTHGGGALVTVSDGDSLEEAIYKLDQAAGGSVTKTLQQAYTDGSGATAGTITLENSREAIKLYDDPVSALGRHIQLYNNIGTEVVRLGSFGMQTMLNTHIRIGVTASTPGPVANRGNLYTQPDATTADAELFFQHSGSGGPAQLTNGGRVTEYLVSCAHLNANSFGIKSSATTPALADWDFADMAAKAVAFTSTANGTAYATVAIPVDKDGFRPTAVEVVLHIVLGPQSGIYSSGSGIVFSLAYPSTNSTIGHLDQIDTSFGAPVNAITTGLGVSSVDDLVVMNFPKFNLTGNNNGVLNLKITRETTHVSDTWAHPAAIVAASINWYRA